MTAVAVLNEECYCKSAMELSRLIRAILQWAKIRFEWQAREATGIEGKHVLGHALHPWNEAVD
eukprot:12425788-Karenia_brevis.AAC.1